MEIRPLKPAEILDSTIQIGVVKAHTKPGRLFVLGILAGAFIAFGAAGSTTVVSNLLATPAQFGLAKALQALFFTPGLMLVLLCGAELFTGDMLMTCAAVSKRISWREFLQTIVIVYVANLVGGILIAYLVNFSGAFAGGSGMVGAMTVKIAAGKTALSFGKAFCLGILCNWLVCLAVWMCFGADTTVGKIFSCFFPIALFVASGYEHCVANMYYIPAGILAKANPDFVQLSGVADDVLSTLTWGGFFVNNLLPVTLGNMVGGIVFVALAYSYAYHRS